jgi:cell division protein FtsB
MSARGGRGGGPLPHGRLRRPGRRAEAWLLVSLIALLGVLLLAGFPARAWIAQRQERDRVAASRRELAAQNRRLEDRARLLQTDAEIERLARKDYNLVRPGEEAFAILPGPSPAPAPAPTHAVEEPDRAWWQRALTRLTDVF